MESYTLSPVQVDGLPAAYILESDSIDRLLVRPGRKLLGGERMATTYETTVTWCGALREGGFLPHDAQDVCTVTILAEGMGHNLPGALAEALRPSFPRGDNFIGVSRFALPRTDRDTYTPFDAQVRYLRLESPAPVWVTLDTVATGATLRRGLETAFEQYIPRRILLGAPAGSAAGMREIARVCAGAGVELELFFFGAVFGLWNDGTALPWCHPDTILSGTPRSERNRAETARIFNGLEGFCAVGDCSANFFDVRAAQAILREEEERFGWTLPLD